MAKTKEKPKKYKTRAAKRRAELRKKGLPIPPPRTIFLPPNHMDLLTTKEKRVYTKKFKWTMAMQRFKVGRTWPEVLTEYSDFPLSHLDRNLYTNYGSIRDRLSRTQDELDDMEGEQNDRRAAQHATNAVNEPVRIL
ncbi:hypothetical protein BOTCAL_0021g00050 [Botryotinia calthae]|uniref:Uncharacterized protein n=1 Tax=Botryotinia calthae TaxID=38488 RepID=A0A4Y8DEL1_9HELO|nr:hypothetical protein BOTCAL_0021g00050 [Botryotinia calthae]